MSAAIDNVVPFQAKVKRGVPPVQHDPHIEQDALQDMEAVVHADIANRLGHDDFAFITVIYSGTRGCGRDYVFGKPVGSARAPGGRWLADMLGRAGAP